MVDRRTFRTAAGVVIVAEIAQGSTADSPVWPQGLVMVFLFGIPAFFGYQVTRILFQKDSSPDH